MKKIIAVFVAIIMLQLFGVACAETHESPILFRGIQWGASHDEAIKALPEGVKTYGLMSEEYWHSTEERMFDESWSDYYKAELGCYEYAGSSSLENVKVAGYHITDLYFYYLYATGEDGLLVRDDAHTSLVYAYYKLEPKDPDAVYDDLVRKLTSLYGDVDLHQQKSLLITYEQNLWYGAEGTMVSLVREDYSSGSHYIYIKYSFSGADDLIARAYDAVILEEARNAALNTDGL